MSRISQIGINYVPFIPSDLEDGVLYVADTYNTASHRCCCGCGRRVVTPLNRAAWKLTEHNGRPSLRPSIGNWSFPCKSHYWIHNGKVEWSYRLSESEIAASRLLDGRDLEAAAKQANRTVHQSWWRRFWRWVR